MYIDDFRTIFLSLSNAYSGQEHDAVPDIYVGCFRTGTSTLPDLKHEYATPVTDWDSCLTYCYDNGYKYAGISVRFDCRFYFISLW